MKKPEEKGKSRWCDCGFARNTKTNRWHVVLRAPKGNVYSNQSFENRDQALAALEKWVKEVGGKIEPFLQ